jgi:hypothetical protein
MAEIGAGEMARRRKTNARNARRWIDGQKPAELPAAKEAAIGAINDCCRFLFGAFAGETDADIIARLPERAAALRWFLAEAATKAVRRFDLSGTARRCGIARNTLREWCGETIPARPLNRVATVAGGLGRWARAEIKAPGRKLPALDHGIAGDLQAICVALALGSADKARVPKLPQLYEALEDEAGKLALDRLFESPGEGWRVAVMVEPGAAGLAR